MYGGLIMNVKELLPIGSVVLLEGAKKKLMIYGVGQTQLNEDKDYDYIGVVYPEGKPASKATPIYRGR